MVIMKEKQLAARMLVWGRVLRAAKGSPTSCVHPGFLIPVP